jgi:hypothetical protein
MPQVIALALLGAGLYAGYRWVTRATREIADQMQRADEALRQEANTGRIEKNLGALEYDPASGVYRPRAPRLTSRGPCQRRPGCHAARPCRPC